MGAVRAVSSAAFPNILLNDIKPLPDSSLTLAQALYEASLTRKGDRRQLEKWEEVESAVTDVVILTESEAEVGMDCLSAIRQRLSERAATPAAPGAMYAKSLRLGLSSMVDPGADGLITMRGADRAEDFGWLNRTMLVASTLDMETEGLFAALQHYVGWKFLHATLPTLDEAGAIVERPAYIEHVPILISRFPARPTRVSQAGLSDWFSRCSPDCDRLSRLPALHLHRPGAIQRIELAQRSAAVREALFGSPGGYCVRDESCSIFYISEHPAQRYQTTARGLAGVGAGSVRDESH